MYPSDGGGRETESDGHAAAVCAALDRIACGSGVALAGDAERDRAATERRDADGVAEEFSGSDGGADLVPRVAKAEASLAKQRDRDRARELFVFLAQCGAVAFHSGADDRDGAARVGPHSCVRRV